ncbi:MAG: Mur ligase family protein [Campylobacterales bacterium]
MQEFITAGEFVSHLILVMALGWYLITNLQWYHYRPERVFFHHTKPYWHVIHLLLPFVLYHATGLFFWIYFYFAYLPALFIWHRKLDKKLVLTARVKRFFGLLLGAALLQNLLCLQSGQCAQYGLLLPLIATLIVSQLSENWLRSRFKKQATAKLLARPNLTVLALTASYGKTSLKHFLAAILKERFKVYATPGNVNTDLGIAADINNKLPADAELYIVEAGAREKGDILTITLLTQPQYAIVGKVGPQHIEYFKTLDNVRSTKRELLVSPRLKRGVVHESSGVKPNDEVVILKDDQIQNVQATLEGTEWDLVLEGRTVHLKTPVLGSFNALNLSLAFLMARELGMEENAIAQAIGRLESVPHRLQSIKTLHKFILDDSYNGNLEGMLAAIELASTWKGRKVIVTPGLVESDEESNIALAKRINEVFDMALITGRLNADLLAHHIDHGKRKRVFDKRGLETILGIETQTGDLILFANDAPSFV